MRRFLSPSHAPSWGVRRVASVAAALVGLMLAPGSAGALTIGLVGYGVLAPGTAIAPKWLADTTHEGAQLVRVDIGWSLVAPPVRPKHFRAANPAARGYHWAPIDATLRILAGRRIPIMIDILAAPTWAETGTPPAGTAGAWQPSASAFGAFAAAAARRYSGRYPDPLRPGHSLPRVRFWQAWNEPNLSVYLAPQWIRVHGRYVAQSPIIYRALLNAFYASVRRVSHQNLVITGGTAPYGDAPGGARMPPVTFVRSLLCLPRPQPRSTGCRNPAHFDALDHHPYNATGPFTPALNPGDVAVPDIGKLTKLLSEARRAGTVAPRGPKQMWVTELAWTSHPPDPEGVSLTRQAQWLEQGFYELWREGVSTVLWLQLADDPPVSQDPYALDAGLFFHNGTSKPAATAFRFPFLTTRRSGSEIEAWGRAPATGKVRIERRSGSRWVAVRILQVKLGAVFTSGFKLIGPATFRAQQGRLTSLSWSQT